MFYSALQEHYLLIISGIFTLYAIASKRDTWVWAILALVSYILWVNKTNFLATDAALYYIRAFVAFFAAVAFTLFKTKQGYYQAFIQLLILAVYGLLEYDVKAGTNLVYDNYGSLIYGLVASQLSAFLPALWARYRHSDTNPSFDSEHYKGVK